MQKAVGRGRSGRSLGSLFCAIAITGLAGCQELSGQDGRPPAAEAKTYDRGAVADRLKAVAIPAGADLYMVPTGLDDEGCETFDPFSEKNPVITAVHHRQADGSFGIEQDPAVCRVEMVPLAPDANDCPRYRAVPVNTELPRLAKEILYYKAADGSYSPRTPKTAC